MMRVFVLVFILIFLRIFHANRGKFHYLYDTYLTIITLENFSFSTVHDSLSEVVLYDYHELLYFFKVPSVISMLISNILIL